MNPAIQTEIYRLLQSGLGSEDIGVLLGVPLADVQREIQRLRESGELARLYGVDMA